MRRLSIVKSVKKRSPRSLWPSVTPQLFIVTLCERPKEAWDALRKHFERETLVNKLFMKKQYFRMEMKEGTSMKCVSKA